MYQNATPGKIVKVSPYDSEQDQTQVIKGSFFLE